MAEVVAGRFELVDVLDRGGVGTVWRAWDHRAQEFVAAKVLRASDSDALIRFVREAKRLVEHPHVLAPRGWTGEDDWVLFAMDLVRGGSVATLIGDFGGLPEGWVVELGRQSAEALAAVHAAGFAHRDVKPANLLLDATGSGQPHLRLSDFGTAGSFDGPRLTGNATVLGTPGYLSPEARRGADPAPAQDIYALGVAMAHMLAGASVEPGRLDAGATPALTSLIAAMTDVDPARRPASARDVVARLHELPSSGRLWQGADPSAPVEVFDHVPPLPPAWAPSGSVRDGGEEGVGAGAHPVVDRARAPGGHEDPSLVAATMTLPRISEAGATAGRARRPEVVWAMVLALLGLSLLVASFALR